MVRHYVFKCKNEKYSDITQIRDIVNELNEAFNGNFGLRTDVAINGFVTTYKEGEGPLTIEVCFYMENTTDSVGNEIKMHDYIANNNLQAIRDTLSNLGYTIEKEEIRE